jgi:hypothetical protein
MDAGAAAALSIFRFSGSLSAGKARKWLAQTAFAEA